MADRIPHPNAVPRIGRRRSAQIYHHPNARWFKYSVHRLDGIGIPENSVTSHHSLERAERAARKWTESAAKRPVVVSRVDSEMSIDDRRR